MAPIINTDDPRATKLLDAAGIEYTIRAPRKTDIIVPVSDFWTISDIHYRGDTLIADLSKRLLPVRTQQQHAEHRNSAQEGEFVTMDMPFYFAMFDSLFEQKDTLEYAGQARDFIQRAMRNKFPIALTRFAYASRGKDTVTHNYGTKDSYQVKANVVGEDRVIGRGNREAIGAVTGIKDIKRLHQIINYINGTDLSIYRLNKKPQELTECVAWLDAGPVDAGVGCDWHPGVALASLGVRVHARSASKK